MRCRGTIVAFKHLVLTVAVVLKERTKPVKVFDEEMEEALQPK